MQYNGLVCLASSAKHMDTVVRQQIGLVSMPHTGFACTPAEEHQGIRRGDGKASGGEVEGTRHEEREGFFAQQTSRCLGFYDKRCSRPAEFINMD